MLTLGMMDEFCTKVMTVCVKLSHAWRELGKRTGYKDFPTFTLSSAFLLFIILQGRQEGIVSICALTWRIAHNTLSPTTKHCCMIYCSRSFTVSLLKTYK